MEQLEMRMNTAGSVGTWLHNNEEFTNNFIVNWLVTHPNFLQSVRHCNHEESLPRVERKNSLVRMSREIFEQPGADVISCAYDVLQKATEIFNALRSRMFILESEATLGNICRNDEELDFAIVFEVIDREMRRVDPDNLEHTAAPISAVQFRRTVTAVHENQFGGLECITNVPMLDINGEAIGVLELTHMSLSTNTPVFTDEERDYLETFATLCAVGMARVIEWENSQCTSRVRSIAEMRSELSSTPSLNTATSKALSSSTTSESIDLSSCCHMTMASSSSSFTAIDSELSATILSLNTITSESRSLSCISVSIDSDLLSCSRSSSMGSFATVDSVSEVEPAYSVCCDPLPGMPVSLDSTPQCAIEEPGCTSHCEVSHDKSRKRSGLHKLYRLVVKSPYKKLRKLFARRKCYK